MWPSTEECNPVPDLRNDDLRQVWLIAPHVGLHQTVERERSCFRAMFFTQVHFF